MHVNECAHFPFAFTTLTFDIALATTEIRAANDNNIPAGLKGLKKTGEQRLENR